MTDDRRLLDVDGLSQYLSMPKGTIYTYVSTGRIPKECVRHIGRALRFERAAIDALLAPGRDFSPLRMWATIPAKLRSSPLLPRPRPNGRRAVDGGGSGKSERRASLPWDEYTRG